LAISTGLSDRYENLWKLPQVRHNVVNAAP
jgi:hypothetical protein